MNNRLNHKELYLGFMVFLMLLLPVFASAETTTYTYDDVNQIVRQDISGGDLVISSSAGAGGTISPAGSTIVAPHGSMTYTISANTDFAIDEVRIDGVKNADLSQGTAQTYTFSDVMSSHSIAAIFKRTAVTLTVSAPNAQGGVVTSSPAGISCGTGNTACSSKYNYGSVVTLTATLSSCGSFTGWSGACSGTNSTCTVTMDADKSVTAAFGLLTYVITASAGSGGTITPSGAVTVNCGSNQAFTMAPNTGYSIAAVYVDGPNNVGTSTSYTFRDIKANHTINATFIANPTTGPIRIQGTTASYYSTLQAAYNAATDGQTIQCTSAQLTGSLSVNRNISVTIQGGYNADFSRTSGSTTTFKGMIQTQSGGGTLTLKDFIVSQ
jgi:hypothetical protein